MFKKDTYIKRREQLRKDIGHGLIIIQGNHEAPCNYTDNTYWFRQDSTFLYFFGLQREDLVGVLDCDNDKDYIFANDYDIDDIIWTAPKLLARLAKSTTFLPIAPTTHAK